MSDAVVDKLAEMLWSAHRWYRVDPEKKRRKVLLWSEQVEPIKKSERNYAAAVLDAMNRQGIPLDKLLDGEYVAVPKAEAR